MLFLPRILAHIAFLGWLHGWGREESGTELGRNQMTTDNKTKGELGQWKVEL